MRLSSLLQVDPVDAERRIQQVLDEARISVIAITSGIATQAVTAFAAFGKGSDHPAQLTLADCMSYACAKAYRTPLLSKGDEFAQTDIQADFSFEIDVAIIRPPLTGRSL